MPFRLSTTGLIAGSISLYGRLRKSRIIAITVIDHCQVERRHAPIHFQNNPEIDCVSPFCKAGAASSNSRFILFAVDTTRVW